MEFSESYQKILDGYAQKGISRKKIGFGLKPAVVVVDLNNGFTDSSFPLGTDMDDILGPSKKLLDEARRSNALVVFVTTAYDPSLLDAGIWIVKNPALKDLISGSLQVEINPKLNKQGNEPLIVKKFASSFLGTGLSSLLTTNRIDTVIVIGATTSGCVRATVVDALQHGFRPIVVRECVKDRYPILHEASLFDIYTKYGDVIHLQEAMGYLKSFADK